MSCAQRNKELATLGRMRELAKATAVLEQRMYVIFEKKDGCYDYCASGFEKNRKIVEYIHYL